MSTSQSLCTCELLEFKHAFGTHILYKSCWTITGCVQVHTGYLFPQRDHMQNLITIAIYTHLSQGMCYMQVLNLLKFKSNLQAPIYCSVSVRVCVKCALYQNLLIEVKHLEMLKIMQNIQMFYNLQVS